MAQADPELAAEVVCAVARAVIAAGDADKRRAVPLGNTMTWLLAPGDGTRSGDKDFERLVGLAEAVRRARDGDADALDRLPDLVRDVREWFGLRS